MRKNDKTNKRFKGINIVRRILNENDINNQILSGYDVCSVVLGVKYKITGNTPEIRYLVKSSGFVIISSTNKNECVFDVF